jgi:hypothetical protein
MAPGIVFENAIPESAMLHPGEAPKRFLSTAPTAVAAMTGTN